MPLTYLRSNALQRRNSICCQRPQFSQRGSSIGTILRRGNAQELVERWNPHDEIHLPRRVLTLQNVNARRHGTRTELLQRLTRQRLLPLVALLKRRNPVAEALP